MIEQKKKRKYIVILGSIMSGLGKGILTSSIAKILQLRGIKVLPIKFDGYLNVDCGTMNPFRHGEVFVLADGSEVDMDFGGYERFLGINLDGKSSITGGKIFKAIIEKERKGKFLGQDVQFIPHVTNHIKDYIKNFAEEKDLDVVIIEVGGTVGDIENGYFIEAMRQLSNEEEVLFIQLTYLPIAAGILKTKPTQHANKLIQSMGIKPEIIVCRSEVQKLSEESKEKIALFCNVKKENIFDDPPLETIYELPLVLEKQNFFESINQYLGLKPKNEADWKDWKHRIKNMKKDERKVKIAIIGKYTKVSDAYVSVEEALKHASSELGIKTEVEMVESSKFEKESIKELKKFDGIIIPGGFGKRGIEGKINVIKYARENEVPLLGLCLGMQLMIVEYARNVAGIKDAHSSEFDKETKNDVITLLPEQYQISYKGGTMRLGNYPMEIKDGTLLKEIYRKEVIEERHRHRYEVNPKFVQTLKDKGLIISAEYHGIVEAIEYSNKKGIGTQAHPELNSKFEKPAPLFLWLVREAEKHKQNHIKERT